MACLIVLGWKILFQQVCLRVLGGGWGGVGGGKTSQGKIVSSVTGYVFCLVTAGTVTSQSKPPASVKLGNFLLSFFTLGFFIIVFHLKDKKNNSYTKSHASIFITNISCALQTRKHTHTNSHTQPQLPWISIYLHRHANSKRLLQL